MHITFTVYTNYIGFSVSDGRSGAEPNLGPSKWQPTLVLLMHKLGVINETGLVTGCTFEIIHA